jgi:5-hydroxyisourate hydrolase-like protein (transthyretin family)
MPVQNGARSRAPNRRRSEIAATKYSIAECGDTQLLMTAKLKLVVVVALGVWLVAAAPYAQAAGRISGQVVNGTTGVPVANQTLQLLMPRGGMQQVSTATTDASGHFTIAASDLATDSFYLLQATYQDVNYHAPVQFDQAGEARVAITVYDVTRTAPPLRIESARIVVRAEGDKAHVQEMFAIENTTNPPRSYVNADGTFHFHLAQASANPTAAVAGLMNMPLPEPVNAGKGPGDFSIQYPLKPGRTLVMVAYDGNYTGNTLALADSVSYPIDTLELLVSPSNLSVDSSLFKSAGIDAESGNAKYQAENVRPNVAFEAKVSGEVSAAEAAASPADTEVKTLPNSMTRLGGPALACLLLILLWGLGVRVTKEWPQWKAQQSAGQLQKALEAEVETLFNSIADLDELYAAGNIAEKPYWKERLELKARLVTALKKAPPALLESYAIRHAPH